MKQKLLLISVVLLALFSSCRRFRCVEGNHQVERQKRHLSETFSTLLLESSFDLEIKDNASDTIEVVAESNLQNLIITEVKNGVLTIKPPYGRCIDAHEKVILYCRKADLQKITVSGSGSIECKKLQNTSIHVSVDGSGEFSADSVIGNTVHYSISGSGSISVKNTKSDETSTSINGSGSMYLSLKTTKINADINGSGKIKASGIANSATLQITSSGNIEAYSLIVNDCDAAITGSGDITITVLDTLLATIKGSGSIKYDGSPNVTTSISGSGSVSKR